MKKVRIVLSDNTVGLYNDALVYKTFLESKSIKTFIYDEKKDPFEVVSVNIFVGNLVNATLLKFAGHNWFMINHEMVLRHEREIDTLKKIDLFICKTLVAARVMTEAKKKYGFVGKITYSKHTTFFKDLNLQKDWNLIIHTAGQHAWKQTDVVINCWYNHSDLPLITITCYDLCESNLSAYISEHILKKIKNNSVKNINFTSTKLDHDSLVMLKNKAGCHICPSMVEGYGHYINEARIVGAVVICTNIEPVNELITSNEGILIECERKVPKTLAELCFIDEKSLYNAVKTYLN